MIFFLDENFSKTIYDILIKKGHKVFDIRGTSEEGKDDFDIFQLAQDKESIFLTKDKDYFHTIPYLYQKHYGIIVITLHQPNRKNITNKLEWVLEHINLNNLKNKVLLLKDKSYFIYEK